MTVFFAAALSKCHRQLKDLGIRQQREDWSGLVPSGNFLNIFFNVHWSKQLRTNYFYYLHFKTSMLHSDRPHDSVRS